MEVPRAGCEKLRLAILRPAVVKLDSDCLKEISSHTLHRNFLWRELQCSLGSMSTVVLAICTRRKSERLYNIRDRKKYGANKGNWRVKR
jgi:hypothetical protein